MADSEGDWDSVTYLRKKTPRAAEMRSKQVTLFTRSKFTKLLWNVLLIRESTFIELIRAIKY